MNKKNTSIYEKPDRTGKRIIVLAKWIGMREIISP